MGTLYCNKNINKIRVKFGTKSNFLSKFVFILIVLVSSDILPTAFAQYRRGECV